MPTNVCNDNTTKESISTSHNITMSPQADSSPPASPPWRDFHGSTNENPTNNNKNVSPTTTTTAKKLIERMDAWTPEFKETYVRIVLSQQLQKLYAGIQTTTTTVMTKEDSALATPSLEDTSVSETDIAEEGAVKIVEMPIPTSSTQNGPSQERETKNDKDPAFDGVDSSYGANIDDDVSSAETRGSDDEEMSGSVASLRLAGAIEVHHPQPYEEEEEEEDSNDADRKYSCSMTEEYSGVQCDDDDTASSTCWTSSNGSDPESSQGSVNHQRTSYERSREPPGLLATQEACWIPVASDGMAETDDNEDEQSYSSSGSSLTASTRENDDDNDDDNEEDEEEDDEATAVDGREMLSDGKLNAVVATMLKDTVTKEDLALPISLHSIAEEVEEQQPPPPKITNDPASQQDSTAKETQTAVENTSSPKSSEAATVDGLRDSNVATNQIKAVPTEHTAHISDEPVVVLLTEEKDTHAPFEADVEPKIITAPGVEVKPSQLEKATDKDAQTDPETDFLDNDSVVLSITSSVGCGPVDIDSGAVYTVLVESCPADLDDSVLKKVSVTRGPVNLDTGEFEIDRIEAKQRLLEASLAMEARKALKAKVDKRERAAFAEAAAEALTEEAQLRTPFHANISGEKTHQPVSYEFDDHLFGEFQTREQQLNDLELRSMPLEAVLLRRFDLGFQEAASLVSDARINIGASNREPWTDELYDECEVLYSLKFAQTGQAKDMVVIMEWPKFLAPAHDLRVPKEADTASSGGNSVGSAASRTFESSTGWSSVWEDSDGCFSVATHDREDEYSVRVIQEIKQCNEESDDVVKTPESIEPRKPKVSAPRQSSILIETEELGTASAATMLNADDTSMDFSELSNMSEKMVFHVPTKLSIDREPKQEQTETKIQKGVASVMKSPKPSSGQALAKAPSRNSSLKHGERESLRAGQPRRKGGFFTLRCCFAKDAVVVETDWPSGK